MTESLNELQIGQLETACWGNGLDSTGLGQSPVADACEHGNGLWGSLKAENLAIRWTTTGFPRTAPLHCVSYKLWLPNAHKHYPSGPCGVPINPSKTLAIFTKNMIK
jgi:hypothetical protein